MPPVKVHWYDGVTKNKDRSLKDKYGAMVEEIVDRPPIVAELEKKYNRDFGDGGTIYVGDKGIMFSGNYASSPHIVPEEKHREFPVPAKTLPRVKGTKGLALHQADFLLACKDGHTPSSHFGYSGGLSEFVLLGCLAERAGVGKRVEWDGPGMKCTNMPELEPLIRREYRKGWTLG